MYTIILDLLTSLLQIRYLITSRNDSLKVHCGPGKHVSVCFVQSEDNRDRRYTHHLTGQTEYLFTKELIWLSSFHPWWSHDLSNIPTATCSLILDIIHIWRNKFLNHTFIYSKKSLYFFYIASVEYLTSHDLLEIGMWFPSWWLQQH